jgi:hypothetical protein
LTCDDAVSPELYRELSFVNRLNTAGLPQTAS